MKADWQRHEEEVNNELSVSSTLASGRFWGDKGDGATYEHPDDDSRIQLQVDEKCTTHNSYSLDVQYMNDCVRRAAKEGKTFVLPVRYQLGDSDDQIFDYVVVRLQDFKFMLGFDQLKTLKKQQADMKSKMQKFKKSVASNLRSLDMLSTANNLRPDQKNVLYKAIDALDIAVEGI